MIAVHSTSPFGGSIAHLFLLYALSGIEGTGDHKGLGKIPRIFLAQPLFSTLAHVLDKSALYGKLI
jgi:hypothetical protein